MTKSLPLLFLLCFFQLSFSQVWLKITDYHFHSLDEGPTKGYVYRDAVLDFYDYNDEFPQKVVQMIENKSLNALTENGLTFDFASEFKKLKINELDKEQFKWNLFISHDLKLFKMSLNNLDNSKTTLCVFPFEKAPIHTLKWKYDYSHDASQDPCTCFSYFTDTNFVFLPKVNKKTIKNNVKYQIPKTLDSYNHKENFITKNQFKNKKNLEVFETYIGEIWNLILKSEIECQENYVSLPFNGELTDICLNGKMNYSNKKAKFTIDELIFVGYQNESTHESTELAKVLVKNLSKTHQKKMFKDFYADKFYAFLVHVNDKSIMTLEESYQLNQLLKEGKWDKILPQKLNLSIRKPH